MMALRASFQAHSSDITVRELSAALLSLVALATVTLVYARWMLVTNATIVALTFLFIVLITVGNLPGLAADMSDAFGDKRLHLAAYAFLTGLIYVSVNRRPALVAMLAVTTLGVVDETIQSLFPYREAELLDLLADISAAGATVISLHIGTAAIGSFRAVTKS